MSIKFLETRNQLQGKAGDATAPCTIAGKQVNAKGCCSAHVKKA
jgi:hypothetical protein